MFPPEYFNPTRFHQEVNSRDKVQVNFSLLESFYKNLIDESIRPDVLDFFMFEDRIDIKEKFNKYEHHKIHINSEDDQNQEKIDGNVLLDKHIKRTLVFNVPRMNYNWSDNKNIPGQSGSKITYFIISQSLKNTITISHINQEKNQIELDGQQKRSIQNLSQFIHSNQAVFFLLRGSLEIHKKIQNQQKNQQNSRHQKIGNQLPNQKKDVFKSPKLKSTQIANLLLEKQIQSHQSQDKPSEKVWKRHLEIKESNFFCFQNYKLLTEQRDVQETFKILPKTSCILAKIQINPAYGKEVLKSKMNKFSIISSFLSSKNQHDTQKLLQLKQIIDQFQEEKIRREVAINLQGKKNQKIYIVGGDGQIQFSKNIYFNQNENVKGFKKLQIINFSGKIIIGAQSYLSKSNIFLDILKDHRISKVENLGKNEKQEDQHQLNRRQIRELQKEISSFKKQPKEIQFPFNQNGKILFGKNCNVFMECNLPKLNQSNFTIKVNSSFATVYSIKLEKFQELASQQVKRKLVKNYQPIYITLLKKSLQKLQWFRKKVQFEEAKKNEQFKTFAALSSVKQSQRFSPELKNQNVFNMSQTKLEFQLKKQFKDLKRNDLILKQSAALDKKVSIFSQGNRTAKDKKEMAEKYKKKIQNLIMKNLDDIKGFDSGQLKQGQKEKIMSQINQFYMGNIDQIVSLQRLNIGNYGLVLNQKTVNTQQTIREIVQKDMFVDSSIFDPSKNKSIKIKFLRKGHPCVKQSNNFLKGVQMQDYTDSIKANVAVRINEANKIKQQYIKIQSKCIACKCYDDLDSYRNLTSYGSFNLTEEPRCLSHDVKYHTMKIGVNWRGKYKEEQKGELKTAYNQKGLQDKMLKMTQDEQPFQRVYNKIKVLKQKSMQRFNFNEHLLSKGKQIKSRKDRKRSLPLFI